MVLRNTLVALAAVALAAPGAAFAAGVQPQRGDSVTGTIAFPRPQQMSINVLEKDWLSLRLGFDGRCKGGGVGELWMSSVAADHALRVRDGAFSGRVTGTARRVGGVASRSAQFTWRVSGRFTGRQAATATISGRAVVRSKGRVISRCEIARPAKATLSHGD